MGPLTLCCFQDFFDYELNSCVQHLHLGNIRMTYLGKIILFCSDSCCLLSPHLNALKLQSFDVHFHSGLVIALLWGSCTEDVRWACVLYCVWTWHVYPCVWSTFKLLMMPFCGSLALLLDEPLSELLPLSLQSVLTVGVLSHQAWGHHLCIGKLCFSTAVWVVQVIFTLAPRLLVLMPEFDHVLFHCELLLHLSSMEQGSYFAIVERSSICMENTFPNTGNTMHFIRNWMNPFLWVIGLFVLPHLISVRIFFNNKWSSNNTRDSQTNSWIEVT